MSKVITLTFNPCIDKSTSITELVPEKKLRCHAPKFEPGGGGINVARALKRLGSDVLAIYPSGGHTGIFFNELLQKENVTAKPISVQSLTRENLIVVDESTNLQYRFGMPGSPLTEMEWQSCVREISLINEPCHIVCSGSLPPGVPPEIFSELAGICKNNGHKLIVDTNGEPLRFAAQAGVYMLKPNLGELAELSGKKRIENEEIIPICRQLITAGRSEIIIVSMGPMGAMLITETETFHVKPPEVERKSTVGAGDSMVAGIVWSLSEHKRLKDVLRFGVACGTAATMRPGTELCRLEDVNQLMRQMPL